MIRIILRKVRNYPKGLNKNNIGVTFEENKHGDFIGSLVNGKKLVLKREFVEENIPKYFVVVSPLSLVIPPFREPWLPKRIKGNELGDFEIKRADKYNEAFK